jgi:hypothetical protein
MEFNLTQIRYFLCQEEKLQSFVFLNFGEEAQLSFSKIKILERLIPNNGTHLNKK